jgi:hypothetical protein
VGVKLIKCDLKKIFGGSMVMAIFEWEKLRKYWQAGFWGNRFSKP